jgi:threonine 3-dehydrogenase
MRAVELYAPGKFRLRDDVPVPAPEPHQVRIKVSAAGICGTDVHICAAHPSMNKMVAPPVILGHEFCGVIDELGAAVPADLELAVDDYVSAEMHEVCRHCLACLDGSFHACMNHRIRGVNLDGAFADYVVVSATNVVKLPRELPQKVGAILAPLGNAVHAALKVPVKDRTVAVVGYGPIGAMAAEVIQWVGARHLFVIDVSQQALERAREWVERRGLSDRVTLLDGRSADPVAEVVAATEGGVDVSVEMSGHPDGINNTLAMTRPAGHVVNLGLPGGADITIQNFSQNFIFGGLTMHAVIGREMMKTWHEMLDLLSRGLDVTDFITTELDMTEFAHGLEQFGKGLTGKVVLYPKGVPAGV